YAGGIIVAEKTRREAAGLAVIAFEIDDPVPFPCQMYAGDYPVRARSPRSLGRKCLHVQHSFEDRADNGSDLVHQNLSAACAIHFPVLSASDVDGRGADSLPLKPLVYLEDRLCPAQQQPSASNQGAVQLTNNFSFGFRIEVDEHIAAEDQVKGPHGL